MSDIIVPPGWVNIRKAAKVTGYSVRRIWTLARTGRIQAVKIGGYNWLVNLDSLKGYKAKIEAMGNQRHNPWRPDLQAEGQRRRKPER